MIGTNYHLDNTFIDGLNFKARDVAKTILADSQLSDLVVLKRNGLTKEVVDTYGIDDVVELNEIINACILTRMTYFDVDVLEYECIALFVKLICDAMRLPIKRPIELHEMTKNKHHVFSKWVLKLHHRLSKIS